MSVNVVLVRSRATHQVHRRVRIEGIRGLMAYPECLEGDDVGDVIPNLSTIREDWERHERCFGPMDSPVEEYGQREVPA